MLILTSYITKQEKKNIITLVNCMSCCIIVKTLASVPSRASSNR